MSLSSLRRMALLSVCLVFFSQACVRAESEKVGFTTYDGVKIEGTFYPSPKGNKAYTVLLLHDFDKNGGSSRTDEWDSLATSLQKKDFAVLSFDFRGFGQSTLIDQQLFFNPAKAPHNMNFPGAKGGKQSTKIEHKSFNPTYYRQLVNDVAAAKAWLDNENDGSRLNSRNMIVIGAGQGATVGMMWLDAEFKRFRGTQVPIQVAQANPRDPDLLILGSGFNATAFKMEKDTAGSDILAGIWLSISPTLAGQFMPVSSWSRELGSVKGHKLPLVFIHGDEKNDPSNLKAIEYLRAIHPTFKRGDKIGDKDKDLRFTHEKSFSTKLVGSKMLQNDLGVSDYIIDTFLSALQEGKPPAQWRQRNNKESFFFWRVPMAQPALAWTKGDELPVGVPAPVVGLTPVR